LGAQIAFGELPTFMVGANSGGNFAVAGNPAGCDRMLKISTFKGGYIAFGELRWFMVCENLADALTRARMRELSLLMGVFISFWELPLLR
jgi:hypothetical protein